MLTKVRLIILLFFSSIVWAESIDSPLIDKEGDIIAYYDKDWQLTNNKVASRFYRKLLKTENNKYLVQDFYSDSNTKQTNPFWITHPEELTSAKVTQQDIDLLIWSADGHKQEQLTYKDGKLIYIVGWYKNGQKSYEGGLDNDQRQGTWSRWYQNGQLGWQGQFVNNLKEGKWSLWYPSGQLKVQGSYRHDYKQDLWFYWDELGTKVKEEQYKDNEKIAQWTSFDN